MYRSIVSSRRDVIRSPSSCASVSRRCAVAVALGSLLSLPSPRSFADDEPSPAPPPAVARAELARHVEFLAADLLAGRDSGEPGLEIAAEYLAETFRSYGLEPAGDRGSYFDYFTAPYGTEFADGRGVAIDFETEDETTWEAWVDAFPIAFGESASVDAPLAFAGYGVSLDGGEYDDFAGLDVAGKILVVLRFVPPGEKFGGNRSPHAPFVAKLAAARQRGAAGVVFVTPPGHDSAGREVDSVQNLQGFVRRASPRHPTVPSILVPFEVAAELFRGRGHDLGAVVAGIDSSAKPNSFVLDGVRLRFGTRPAHRVLRNVAARLPGAGKLADETIVVGGHYDHIGRFGNQVQRSNFGAIHNGADDNASGTAGILEVARVLAGAAADGASAEERRSVLFLCFSGEEIGLLGSRHWVRSPRRYRLRSAAKLVAHPGAEEGVELSAGTTVVATRSPAHGSLEVEAPSAGRSGWLPLESLELAAGPAPLHQVKAMVNLDMIGRAKGSDPVGVSVIGADSSPAFDGLLAKATAAVGGIEARPARGPGGGGSDHAPFLSEQIPVLFFFTGMHRDYNRPTDDLETLNLDGLTKIVDLVRATVENLAASPTAPVFNPHSQVASSGSNRPQLGVLLQPADARRGALVREVVTDSVAEKAGVRAGDLVHRFGKTTVRSVADLVRAVRAVEAGSEIEIEVTRGDESVSLTAKFPARRGFGVSFGSVPDYAFESRGVRFEDIRDGSAAAAAGVKAGDVLVEWGGKEVENVQHWTGFLREHKPGDKVEITVLRGEERVTLEVELKAR